MTRTLAFALLLTLAAIVMMGCNEPPKQQYVYRLLKNWDGTYEAKYFDERLITVPYKDRDKIWAMVDSVMALQDTVYFTLNRKRVDVELNHDSTFTIQYIVTTGPGFEYKKAEGK